MEDFHMGTLVSGLMKPVINNPFFGSERRQ
jgi:hypothetical protein